MFLLGSALCGAAQNFAWLAICESRILYNLIKVAERHFLIQLEVSKELVEAESCKWFRLLSQISVSAPSTLLLVIRA
jgi:hypothetical protein